MAKAKRSVQAPALTARDRRQLVEIAKTVRQQLAVARRVERMLAGMRARGAERPLSFLPAKVTD